VKKVTKIDKIQPSKVAKKKLRVAAYCRVSTDSDAQLESLETQKTHYENYINSRDDWEFAGLYFDEGITGTKADKRPKLMRLIEDCKAKKVDFVITKSISRFSRNTTDCLDIVRTLLNLNIPVYFEKENINTGSMESELFLSILSSMAEGESTSISKNNKWGIKKRFENGTYKLGYVPYGYRWENGEIIVDPEQAVIVKRIFSELLAGKGTDAIAKSLNAENVPTQKGGRWTSTSIRGILANEKYTGDCIFQKTYTDSNFNRHKNDGQLDQYYVADHREAIISHEDFDAAAALIEQRANEKGIKRGSNKYQQRYAFSGKIICSECGDTFRRRIHTSTYVKYPAWVCNTHLNDSSKCSMLYLKDDDIKLAFATMINKLIYCHKLVLKPYLESLQANASDKALLRIQQLETLLEQNAEQRETLHKLMAQGYIDQILFTQENNVLLTQANDFRSDIEALNRSVTGDTSKVYETERLIHFCERSEMLLEYSEDLFELFVDHIEVYSRQSIGFVLHCGLTFKERI
jgi:site-specific DNA recombinase